MNFFLRAWVICGGICIVHNCHRMSIEAGNAVAVAVAGAGAGAGAVAVAVAGANSQKCF